MRNLDKLSEPSPNKLSSAAESVGFKTADRYRARSNFLFNGIKLAGSSVLDVGCGKGAFAIWAGLKGATRVLGIEPETDGSTAGTLQQFENAIKNSSLCDVIQARSCLLEDLETGDGPFDVVMMYQVINHINEEAVIRLHNDSDAVDSYLRSLRHLRSLMNTGSIVIVADCDKRNFWNDIGLRNPLMPTIEWEKHQPPYVWEKLFSKSGFKLNDLRWSPMYPLGHLSSNWSLHYFTISHFTMRFIAV